MVLHYANYNYEYSFKSPFEHPDIMENKNIRDRGIAFWNEYGQNEGLWDFLSIMLVNNESGRIFDIKKYTDSVHKEGCIIQNGKLHSDMSQAFGKIPINIKDLDVDFATFSSQKIGSIRGCSVLYVKEPKAFKNHFDPLIYGHQENGLRGGTENTVAIACMGLAMEKYNYDEVINDVWRQYKQIMTRAFNVIPGAVVLNTNTDTHKFTNNVIQVSFKGVESESLVLMCDSQGLCISGGAACNSGSLEPSNEVKYLCGLHDPNTVNPRGVVRISYGWGTATHDIDQTIKIIKQAVTNLREINGGIR
jgi:cysteine desulfurase